MRLLAMGIAAALAAPGGLAAQQPDTTRAAEAFGIYRPPAPAVDTAADTAGVADTAAPDTATVPDTIPERVEVTPDPDTSLTARMDVRRGGGLSREEFPDLLRSAAVTGRYAVYLDLLSRDDSAARLQGLAPLTIVAPTDSAFARLPRPALERLRGDSLLRSRWLAGTLIEGSWSSVQLLAEGKVPMAGGPEIRFRRALDGSLYAGPARVVQPDVLARNGVLHGVDRVILPDTTAAAATSAAP